MGTIVSCSAFSRCLGYSNRLRRGRNASVPWLDKPVASGNSGALRIGARVCTVWSAVTVSEMGYVCLLPWRRGVASKTRRELTCDERGSPDREAVRPMSRRSASLFANGVRGKSAELLCRLQRERLHRDPRQLTECPGGKRPRLISKTDNNKHQQSS
jgi:hypothetical protein